MGRWYTPTKTMILGLAVLCLGALTACVETTYTTLDGQVATTTTSAQTDPAYRMVMTPNGLRVITPEGFLIDPEQAPASANVQNMQPTTPPVIAILLPLTGTLSEIGEAMKQGAKLAIKEKGIVGTFETRIYDTRSSNTGAQAAASKALQDGAKVILGPLRGEAIAPVSRLASRRRVNVVSFSNDITRATPNAYVMGITPEAVTKRVLEYSARRGQRRIAVVAPSDTYGRAAADAANGLADYVGAQIVFTENYPADANDRPGRTAVAQSVGDRSSTFDAIYLPDTAEAGDMASLLYFYGVNPQRVRFLGVPIWDQQANQLISEQALLGAVYASPAERGFAAFQASFKGAFGASPHPLSSVSYDGVAMVLEIAGRTPNPTFSNAELERPQGFEGVDGPFALRFDKRVERGMAIKRISSVGLELVEDAPLSLYRSTTTSMTIQAQPGAGSNIGTSTVTQSPNSTATYTTTRVTQTQVYAPQGDGGWIGTGENRVWVPADS